MAHISLDQARAAKKAAQARLEAAGHDAAVGITRVDGEYAVKVDVQTAHEARAVDAHEIDGVRVRVEVVGAIRPRKAGAPARRP
jgi:predicted phage tail protein